MDHRRTSDELRNLQGTGHGRTLPTGVSADLALLVVREARSIAQFMLGADQPEAVGRRARSQRMAATDDSFRCEQSFPTTFVKSAVNQVVSKRMAKKQQMRWTPRGAHLLLQVRTRVLNDDLAADFRRWHPGFTRTEPDPNQLAPAT